MHPIAPYARAAYAHGVAASGGPITDRVRAGMVAAIQEAVDNADDPTVLAATLQLGKLEGTWAKVYQRRLQLHADNDQELRDAWRAMLQGQDYSGLISTLRQHFALTEAADPAARAAADWIAGLLRRLLDAAIHGASWMRMRQLLRKAAANARAEGAADALALAAQQHDLVDFAFDIAFNDAYAALGDLDRLISDNQIDNWLSNLLGDVSDQVGQTLAAMVKSQADRDSMMAAVQGLLGDADSRAITTAVDLLTSRAMSQGALDLYRREGVVLVDFITAGDARVCNDCFDAESNGPYTLADAPVPGLHPLCRCALNTSTQLPLDSVAAYGGGDAL